MQSFAKSPDMALCAQSADGGRKAGKQMLRYLIRCPICDRLMHLERHKHNDAPETFRYECPCGCAAPFAETEDGAAAWAAAKNPPLVIVDDEKRAILLMGEAMQQAGKAANEAAVSIMEAVKHLKDLLQSAGVTAEEAGFVDKA